jgi:small ligand-binding sensory domain FIST
MMNSMQWANALSTRPSLEAAIEEVVTKAQEQLQTDADLGLVFISAAFASEYTRVMPLLRKHLSVPALVGCGGGGVVGMSRGQAEEIEEEAALSLTLAHLPEVQVQTFHIDTEHLPDMDSPPAAWVELVGVDPQDNPQFILLSDPASSGTNELLQGLNFAYPDSVKVGGLAGMNPMTGQGGLFLDAERLRGGTVGVALMGNIVLETIVAQGCRPIGQPYRVAEAERNILTQLEEQPQSDIASCGLTQTPLEVLQNLIQTLDESDRQLAQRALFVGVAQSAFKQNLEQGDFLIRNLLGVDPRTGAIAIGDRIRVGQRIQFHLRDAQASEADLRSLLIRYQTQRKKPAPAGALMFACLGRGEGLYQQPNFDSHLFNQYVSVPVSGFFCSGEIGPVGDTTFLHGYTSVFGICRPKA